MVDIMMKELNNVCIVTQIVSLVTVKLNSARLVVEINLQCFVAQNVLNTVEMVISITLPIIFVINVDLAVQLAPNPSTIAHPAIEHHLPLIISTSTATSLVLVKYP